MGAPGPTATLTLVVGVVFGFVVRWHLDPAQPPSKPEPECINQTAFSAKRPFLVVIAEREGLESEVGCFVLVLIIIALLVSQRRVKPTPRRQLRSKTISLQ